MNKIFLLGTLATMLFFVSGSDAEAVCCFPYEITHYVDPQTGNLIVSGQLWNDSYNREPFGNAKYEFIFENSTGDVLFTKEMSVTDGHPIDGGFVVNPYGGPLPFQITIKDIDQDTMSQVNYVHTGKTSVDYFGWKPPELVAELEAIKMVGTVRAPTLNENLEKWQLKGTITNTHSERVENIYVLASLYGTDDRFVGVAGYSKEDKQPISLDAHETKEFVIYSLMPHENTIKSTKLYAESDSSSMIYQHTEPLILKTADNRIKRAEIGEAINISANITNISRNTVDFEWIIQIKKSPKPLSEGDITKHPDSKVEFIRVIPEEIEKQNSKVIRYSWLPDTRGIYFYEMYLWDDENPVSLPFRGTFLSSDKILVTSNSLKEQLRSGSSLNEIECKSNMTLLQKYDGSPACVSQDTKMELIRRGWSMS